MARWQDGREIDLNVGLFDRSVFVYMPTRPHPCIDGNIALMVTDTTLGGVLYAISALFEMAEAVPQLDNLGFKGLKQDEDGDWEVELS